MRDYKAEFKNRVDFIRMVLSSSGAEGIVFGNSGGKDSALVGILCKAACDNTVGIILPCTSKRNYTQDTVDANEVAVRYDIETRTVDLTPVKEAELKALEGVADMNAASLANIAPRLRMLTLYAIAAAENRLVAGTGNRSETYVGYFTIKLQVQLSCLHFRFLQTEEIGIQTFECFSKAFIATSTDAIYIP